MKNVFLLLALAGVLESISCLAQDKLINFNVGYGMVNDKFKYYELDSPFNSVIKLGVNFTDYYTKTTFRYTTGINFISREWSSQRLNYLNIPLGLQFISKSKIKLLVGGGIYMNTLLWVDNQYKYSDHTKVCIGGYGQIGTGYQITDKYSLILSLRINGDISETTEETARNYIFSTTILSDSLWDKILIMGVYYSL